MKRNSKRVLIGMSGGLDSSVAAALLVKQGYEVIGITIKTYNFEDVGGNVGNDSSCCSLDGINDARRVALQLGIPHYVVDFTEAFKQNVIDYFVEDYIAGRTPNPCVKCNRTIKWNEMLRKADSLGAEYIATGHYAFNVFSEETNRWYLQKSDDAKKDQSYALWGLTQEALSRTIFPLSSLTKNSSRELAEEFGLHIAQKKESYEICFIPDNNYGRFLNDVVPTLEESVKDGSVVLDGKEIGKHKGYPFYTIGQRKGLGVSHHEPLFVLNVLPSTNEVIVGTEDKLLRKGLFASEVNMMKYAAIEGKLPVKAKIRYKNEGAEATCEIDEFGKLRIEFQEEQKAITPGQSVVVYEGSDVVGGGIIESAF